MTFEQGALARVRSVSVVGIQGTLVGVEVDLARGLPRLTMVGLPDAAIRESRDRVRSAIKNADLKFPLGRITVNFAPADVRKAGPRFDLPLALGLLAVSRQVPAETLEDLVVLGELSLSGEVRPVKGALPAVLAARDAGLKEVMLPEANDAEAAAVDGIRRYPVRTLMQAVAHLAGEDPLPPSALAIEGPASRPDGDGSVDFADVRGQEHVKRALEIAAAGGHNVLLIGPPGTGKTMLARRLPGVLPPLTREEALEITKIHSVAGALGSGGGLVRTRPFRSPHHTISDAGLVGGGSTPHVGEVSLAHQGVLFLDELPEFKRHVLEVLRQPLEDGRVTIVRSGYAVEYPARISLVAAMNPCPCGHLTNPRKACRCTPREIKAYRARLSGPLLDRLDLHVEVPAVSIQELSQRGRRGESSRKVAGRVVRARARQTRRFAGSPAHTNGQMASAQVRAHCALNAEGMRLLESAVEQFGLSARAYDRVLKVARTVADLADSAKIAPAHVAEALQYRVLDREGW